MKKTKLCAFLSGAAALSLFAAAFSALPAAADDSLPDVSDAEIPARDLTRPTHP